jgi:hypothetical protein
MGTGEFHVDPEKDRHHATCRVDVNLEELDRVLDGAREAVLIRLALDFKRIIGYQKLRLSPP